VLDEAHKVKNEQAAITKTIREIPASNRIYVSGTPVTNHAREEINAVKHFLALSWHELKELPDKELDAASWVQKILIRRVKTDRYPDTGKPMLELPGKLTSFAFWNCSTVIFLYATELNHVSIQFDISFLEARVYCHLAADLLKVKDGSSLQAWRKLQLIEMLLIHPFVALYCMSVKCK
jgi:hypothetical protein